MNGKKSRSREQRTKPGTNQKQVPVRIVISQADFTRMKELERAITLAATTTSSCGTSPLCSTSTCTGMMASIWKATHPTPGRSRSPPPRA